MSNAFDRNKTKEAKLGELITEAGAQNQRDAVHIAVVPVMAMQQLSPGDHVGVSPDGKAAHAAYSPHVGIVDPFLRGTVRPEQTFWLCLYQGQVTTLRHEWTHPAFPNVRHDDTASVKAARDRMTTFASECEQTLEDFLENLKRAVEDEKTTGWGSVSTGNNQGVEPYAGFWNDFQDLTGVKLDREPEIGFSCSC